MKLQEFSQRPLNLDSLIYNLDVRYAPDELNDKESVQYTNFQVYHSLDLNTIKFVAVGKYFKKKTETPFKIVVDEMLFSEYDAKFIQVTFFNNRNTLNGLVQAFHNGYVPTVVEKEEVIPVPDNFVEVEYDDTMVQENVQTIKEVEEVVLEQIEPIIIAPKKPKVVAKAKKPVKKAGKK